MKPTLTLLTVLVLAAGAHASEVYRTKDAKGQPVYTDKPVTLPAERLDVKTSSTDVVDVQKRYEAELKRYAETDQTRSEAAAASAEAQKAKELSAEDKARRCQEARQRYESYMNAQRLYAPGATEGERRYLTDAEIDATRERSKQTMDEFCSGN